MKRIFALFLIIGLLFTSCADTKVFTTSSGKKVIAEPYGWADSHTKKNPKVRYRISVGNVVWSILLSESAIVPIALTGWYLYEPVEYIE